MQKTRSHHVPASVEAVAAAMDTDAFLLARAKHDPACVSARVERSGPGRARVVSTMYSRNKVGVINKKKTEELALEYTWAADRRTLRWRWQGDTVIKVVVDGTWSLAADGSGTRIDSRVDVDVKARLVGRMVEGIVSGQLEAAEAALGADVEAHLP